MNCQEHKSIGHNLLEDLTSYKRKKKGLCKSGILYQKSSPAASNVWGSLL